MTARKKKGAPRRPPKRKRQLGRAVNQERLMPLLPGEEKLPPLPAKLRGPDRFMGVGLSVSELADAAAHSLSAAYCTEVRHKVMQEGRWIVPCPECRSWALQAIHDALDARHRQRRPR